MEYSESGLATLAATPLSAAILLGLGLLSLLAGADSAGSRLVDLPLDTAEVAPLGLVLGGRVLSAGLNPGTSFMKGGAIRAFPICFSSFVSLKELLLLWDLLLERLRSLAFLLSSSLARACVSNLICDSSLPWSHLFVGSPATSFSLYDPSYFLLLLDALGTGRLVGLGLSFSLTADPAGGAMGICWMSLLVVSPCWI